MSIYIVSKKIALTDLIRNKVENTFIKLEKYLGNNKDIYIIRYGENIQKNRSNYIY